MLAIEVITFGFAWWLGLYLWQRPKTAVLRWTALGMLTYALALALSSLGELATGNLADILRLQIPILLAPLLFWLCAIWQLREQIKETGAGVAGVESPKTAVSLIFISIIFLGLSIGLILLPFDLLPRRWMIIAISVDVFLFGYAIGILDAFQLGETLLPDFLRSYIEAETLALLIGLQIGLLMWLNTGITFPITLLLFIIIATTIAASVFSQHIQAFFDRIVFARWPTLREERADLRELTRALPRTQTMPTWTDEEFAKLTRTALSNLGNMPKLAASPLIDLPLVTERIGDMGGSRLAKADILKGILVEGIDRLRPDKSADFGTSKAWRHYNALHFPYVRGIRPFARYANNTLNPTDQQAQAWFMADVPPRTLYNWQSAAATLIAKDLQDQLVES